MPSPQITPPTPLDGTAYNTGVDKEGKKLEWATHVQVFPAAAAVAEGAPVSLGSTTSSAGLTVHESDADTATDEATCVGIALNAATAAGDMVRVGNIGYVLITDGDDADIGEGLPLDTNAGEVAAGTVFVRESHCFVALESEIVDFYGSGLDAVLAMYVGGTPGP